ncbi:MAG: hypothetical protein RIS92_346 [Verrucomicrobiota bacterium]
MSPMGPILASLAIFPEPCAALHFFEHFGGVSEGVWVDVHLVHQGEEETAELALRFVFVIEHAASFESATSAAQNDDGQLIVIVPCSGHHARAMQNHRVV